LFIGFDYIGIEVTGFEPATPASQKQCSTKLSYTSMSGEGGIRTHVALADKLVFKTRAINHSTTSPYLSSKSSLLTFL
tara:strand:- start:24 stop:257 length:234 start_codon:yes stop_codon:yes gene_type:complete